MSFNIMSLTNHSVVINLISPPKALAEERSVYNRSVNKLKYLSIAVNALKKLKNQSAVPAKGKYGN